MTTTKEQVHKIAKVHPRLGRGYLAEDYDGIGQHVLVSLARSSVGSAYRARIASGDFGGGRIFPLGTPVVIHSHHGQLEVLSLGNIPGCHDPLDREEVGGWNEGPMGLWTPPRVGDTNPTGYLVTDGSGVIDYYDSPDPTGGFLDDPGQGIFIGDVLENKVPFNVYFIFRITPRTNRFNHLNVTINIYVASTWGVSSVGANDNYSFSILTAVQDSPDLIVSAVEQVATNTSFTGWDATKEIVDFSHIILNYSGKVLRGHLQFDEDGFRGSIWEDGAAEPEVFQVQEFNKTGPSPTLQYLVFETLEPGRIELLDLKTSSCKGGEVAQPGLLQFDDFNREIGLDFLEDWGTSENSGAIWGMYDGPGIYVTGGLGILDAGAGSSIAGVSLSDALSSPEFPDFLRVGNDIDFTARFKISGFVDTPDSPDTLRIDFHGGAVQFFLDFTTEVGWGQVYVGDNSTGFLGGTDFTDWQVGVFYRLRALHEVSGAVKFKVWRDADAQPDWLLERTANPTYLQDDFSLVLFRGDAQAKVSFDWVDFAAF